MTATGKVEGKIDEKLKPFLKQKSVNYSIDLNNMDDSAQMLSLLSTLLNCVTPFLSSCKKSIRGQKVAGLFL